MEILEKVEQLKAELDSLQPVKEDVEARIWQKFRLDWNYHSNKLEGNTYSFGETKMLLLKGLTAGGKPVRDHEEISGHDEAISFILESIREKEELTEVFIRHLHKMILVRPFWADAKTPDGQPTKRLIKVGEYKTEPNHVETQTGAIFYFAEPIETPAKMQELVEWFRVKSESPETNAILLAAEFHYRFVRIHPFDDGNGRIGRLLMNYILMKHGFPPVIIKNEDKDNYIAVLEQADFNILEPLVTYVAQNLVRSLEMMIKGARGEDIEEPEDLDKEIAFLKQKVKTKGQRAEIPKNKEVLLSLFENSIEPLIGKFIETCQKFADLYLDTRFLLFWGGGATHIPTDKAIANAKSQISENDNVHDASLHYDFINFRQTGFNDFNFSSVINVKFNLANYRITLGRENEGYEKLCYEKLYSEQLSEKEIAKIVKLLGQEHKQFIEDQLKKAG